MTRLSVFAAVSVFVTEYPGRASRLLSAKLSALFFCCGGWADLSLAVELSRGIVMRKLKLNKGTTKLEFQYESH